MTKWFLLTTIFVFIVSCSNLTANKKNERDKKTELYFAQGTEMLVKKDYSRALEYLLEAQRLAPNDSEIQNNLGMSYFFKNRMDQAKIHLTKAIELDPKNSNARNNYASLLFREKNYKEAKIQYEMVKADLVYPHQYRTNYNLALIAEVENDLEGMIKFLNESVAERDDFCPAHFKLGEFNFKNNNLSAALRNYKNSSKGTCYNYAAPLYQQALIWRKLAAPDKEFGKLSEIITNFPKSEYAQMAKEKLISLLEQNPEMREKIQLSLDEFNKKEIDNL